MAAGDWEHMGRALALAGEAAGRGEVPVGAVVVDDAGAIVGEGHNLCEATPDATAHAEVLALRGAAARLGRWRLTGCTLVVTLEPCLMCVGALLQARVQRLVFAAADARGGCVVSRAALAVEPLLGHQVQVVGGLRAEEAAAMLRAFFAALRCTNKGAKGGLDSSERWPSG